MKVNMKLKEKAASNYCSRFKKDWATYCTVSDSFLNGYDAAMNKMKELIIIQKNNWGHGCSDIADAFERLENDIAEYEKKIVEVEFKDGEHQLGARSTD